MCLLLMVHTVKQVFPTFEVLGWYSTGIEPTEEDMHIHKQVRFLLSFLLGLSGCGSLTWGRGGHNPPRRFFLEMHQFLAYNESPLFLQLNPQSVEHTKDLPLSVYESAMEIVDNAPRTLFVRSAFKVETGEAERIAVDHTSKPSDTGGPEGDSSS
jgi:COP9 signalosome complex subunit 6